MTALHTDRRPPLPTRTPEPRLPFQTLEAAQAYADAIEKEYQAWLNTFGLCQVEIDIKHERIDELKPLAEKAWAEVRRLKHSGEAVCVPCLRPGEERLRAK